MNQWTCDNPTCGIEFEQYASQRKGTRAYCSVACRNDHAKTITKGTRNPNYRHGRNVDPKCGCGRPKDPRSKQCAMCAGIGRPMTGETRYTDEDLRRALQEATSLQEAARCMGISRNTVTRFAYREGLDLSHMVRGRGRWSTPEMVFCIRSKRDNGLTRKYLRLLEPDNYLCAICGIGPEWNGRELVLQIDHINGDCCDNRRKNIRWLCPNCHSQTDTFTGRNVRRKEAPA